MVYDGGSCRRLRLLSRAVTEMMPGLQISNSLIDNVMRNGEGLQLIHNDIYHSPAGYHFSVTFVQGQSFWKICQLLLSRTFANFEAWMPLVPGAQRAAWRWIKFRVSKSFVLYVLGTEVVVYCPS